MKNNRPTLRDVARQANVSHQTVSRVINQEERVSPDTRARVENVIRKLGYRPNVVARSMAQGRTYTLACLAPNLTDYTFASIIEGAEAEARQNGYLLFSTSAPTPSEFGEAIETFVVGRRTDGLMVINPYVDSRAEKFVPAFPTIFVGGQGAGYMAVMLDDENAARQAVQHLIDLGHRRIAMLTGPTVEACVRERIAGYHTALSQAGLVAEPAFVAHGDWSASSGYVAAHHWLASSQPPTAIFAQNDRMALGILRAARERGLNVPAQLAVIGIDDMPLASYFDPPLTTMRQDMLTIGREAARMLIQAIEDPAHPAHTVRIPAELVVRRSTAPEAISA